MGVIADIPHPIAGYFGTMTIHNDIEMMNIVPKDFLIFPLFLQGRSPQETTQN